MFNFLIPPDADEITKSDSTILQNCIGLYIGGAGDVNVVTEKGTTVLFEAVPAGTQISLGITKVLSTSTTASKIVGFYNRRI